MYRLVCLSHRLIRAFKTTRAHESVRRKKKNFNFKLLATYMPFSPISVLPISLGPVVCRDSRPFQKNRPIASPQVEEEFHLAAFNLAPLHWCYTISPPRHGDIMYICKIMIFLVFTGRGRHGAPSSDPRLFGFPPTADTSRLSVRFHVRQVWIPTD